MNAMTCCCAPAPIESIAITAATPKIIPSIVRTDRSLCARRLSNPCVSSGRMSSRAVATGRRRSSRHPRPGGGARRLAWRSIAGRLGADQRHLGAFRTGPRSATRLSVRCRTLIGRRIEARRPSARRRSACPSFSNTALPRQQQHVVHFASVGRQPRRDVPGSSAGFGLSSFEGDLELAERAGQPILPAVARTRSRPSRSADCRAPRSTPRSSSAPASTLARSCSLTSARTSILVMSKTSMTCGPG